MKRFFSALSVTVFLGWMTGCANHPSQPTPAASPTHHPALTAAEDPDEDGDNRGAGYFPLTQPATGKNVFIFDPNYHAWAAYNAEGQLVNTGKASGGKDYCPDINKPCRTIEGTFAVYRKGGEDCISNTYPIKTKGGARTPYCMFFEKSGYAVHGSFEMISDSNQSHGCIRVTPLAAKWLNNDFVKIGTTVIVVPYKG